MAESYGASYLEGLQTMAGIQDLEAKRQEQQRQGEMARRSENYRLQKERSQDEAAVNERSILREVFSQKADARTDSDITALYGRLSQQYADAGRRLMGVNPKDGLSLMKESDALRTQGDQAQVERLKADHLRDQYLGTVAAGVSDQNSLDEAKTVFAKQGKTIPAKYQTWGAATKSWLERVQRLSIPVHEQQRMEIEMRQIKIREDDERRKQVRDNTKEKEEAARETRRRDNLQYRRDVSAGKAEAGLGLRGEKAVMGEVEILKGMDKAGVFSSKATPGQQLEAAYDVHMRAQQMIRADRLVQRTEEGDDSEGDENKPLSPEAALRLARHAVLTEFAVKKGEHIWSSDTAERKPQVGGVAEPAKPTAAKEPIKLSPGANPESLIDGQPYSTPMGILRWDAKKQKLVSTQ